MWPRYWARSTEWVGSAMVKSGAGRPMLPGCWPRSHAVRASKSRRRGLRTRGLQSFYNTELWRLLKRSKGLS